MWRIARIYVWSGIGVKIKVAFHCTDLAFYALLFAFNVESVAFSYCVANWFGENSFCEGTMVFPIVPHFLMHNVPLFDSPSSFYEGRFVLLIVCYFLMHKAWFKRRILHAPNRIAKLNACKMRRLNQLNAAYFNSMRVSRICDWSSRICDWSAVVDLNAAFYMCRIELKLCKWFMFARMGI